MLVPGTSTCTCITSRLGSNSAVIRRFAIPPPPPKAVETNRGKLLQHKLIGVPCSTKNTRVPLSPIPENQENFIV